MTRKFLFCFPLRMGNVVFGYIVIILCMAVVAFNLYQLGLTLVSTENNDHEAKPDGIFGDMKNILGEENKYLASLIVKIYYLTYAVIGFLLFLFASIFTCGAYKVKICPVKTFFAYSFIHLFLTIILIAWEGYYARWIHLGLILLFDLLHIICLISVKYLIEAIRNGNIYSRPGEEMYKY